MSQRDAVRKRLKEAYLLGGRNRIPLWLYDVTKDYKPWCFGDFSAMPSLAVEDDHRGTLEFGRKRIAVSKEDFVNLLTAIAEREDEVERLHEVNHYLEEIVRRFQGGK